MDGSGGDVEKVSLLDWEFSKKVIPPPLTDHLVQFLPGFCVMADDNVSVLIAVQYVPALRFSLGAVFVGKRVLVIRMDLDA